MKKLELITTKKLLAFNKFIANTRFQFSEGIYQSFDGGTFHLSFMNNPLFKEILFSDNLSGIISLPENASVGKYRLTTPASCMEMSSEVGWKRSFTVKTFLATVWSLLYEQGENTTGFILKDCLFLFPIRYPDGTLYTASMMLMNIGAYYEYSVNIGEPKMYEDTWSVNSSEDKGTYLLVPVSKS